jgi:hypothetical protein
MDENLSGLSRGADFRGFIARDVLRRLCAIRCGNLKPDTVNMLAEAQLNRSGI